MRVFGEETVLVISVGAGPVTWKARSSASKSNPVCSRCRKMFKILFHGGASHV